MTDRLTFAVDLAHEAGDLVLKKAREGAADQVDYKGRRDLVTTADRASEDLIAGRIRAVFPEDGIAAEEGREQPGTSGLTWHVDPLDGTTNFAHGHPFWAVSIGLARGDEPILGAVRAPLLGEIFAGEFGKTATRNGEPIHVSETRELIRALLATGFAYNRNDVPDNNIDNFSKLLLECQGMRRAGAASLDLCFVACGIIDAFWEFYLAPWDVCAGSAIVLAAGGRVTDHAGGGDYVRGGRIVASNGYLHEPVRSRLH